MNHPLLLIIERNRLQFVVYHQFVFDDKRTNKIRPKKKETLSYVFLVICIYIFNISFFLLCKCINLKLELAKKNITSSFYVIKYHAQPVLLILSTKSQSKVPMVLTILKR